MAWHTGKTKLVCASLGDSNGYGSGGSVPPGGQVFNPDLECYASASGQVPYSEANLGWRVLDPNGISRANELISSQGIGDLTYIGQGLGSNGNSAMQMASTLQLSTSATKAYLYQTAAGGTTADFWANLGGWSTLERTIPTALSTIPGSPTYFDVIFISLGTNDVIQGVTAATFYSKYSILRAKMVRAGWWVPGVTQVVLMSPPYAPSLIPFGWPGWQGQKMASTRPLDYIGVVDLKGAELSQVFPPVHPLPPSQTAIGEEAAQMLLAGLPLTTNCIVKKGTLKLKSGTRRLRAYFNGA
jgi:hypothetical protein